MEVMEGRKGERKHKENKGRREDGRKEGREEA